MALLVQNESHRLEKKMSIPGLMFFLSQSTPLLVCGNGGINDTQGKVIIAISVREANYLHESSVDHYLLPPSSYLFSPPVIRGVALRCPRSM